MAAVGARTGQRQRWTPKQALGVQMLAYQVDGRHEQAAGHEAFIERIERHPDIAAELVELSGLLQARSTSERPRRAWARRHAAVPARRLWRA